MDELLKIARRQIDVFIDTQIEEDLPRGFMQVRRASNDISFMRSSRYILELDRVCAQLVEERGIAVWEIVQRCISTGGIEYSPSLAEDLKRFASPYLTGDVGGLTARAAQESDKNYAPTGSESSRKRALSTLESEIDLFCTQLLRAPKFTPYQAPQVINIHGSTVANLQTGDHSSASITTYSSSNQYGDITTAVELLKKELITAGAEEPPLVLIQEVESELAQSTPRPARLKSLLTGITSCVSGILDQAPKVPLAIEGVKRALDML